MMLCVIIIITVSICAIGFLFCIFFIFTPLFGGLEESTRTSSNYVDEDYPARPEIKQSLTGWGDNCGSESSTLETDVCVCRYAPLVVHATQEEEGFGYLATSVK